MPASRCAILHIGTAKTGTTSIQRFLHDHREALPSHGYAFAAAPGKRNHLALAAFAAGEGYTGNSALRAGAGGGDGASIGPRLARDIVVEVAALPDQVRTVIYSSEQLATRPDGPPDIARVKALLDPCFDRFIVVVYLRRQDEVAVSKYSSALRAGGETDAEILPAADRGGGRLYDLEGILGDWAAVFGRDAMRPRVFERASLRGGDVVTDFLSTIGLDGLPPPATPPGANPALKAEVQELVRRFNALTEARGVVDRARLGRFLRDPLFQGRPRLPSRDAAIGFMARFEAANERVRAMYFPDRKSLFAAGFDRYPERDSTTGMAEVTDAMVADAALEVLRVVTEALRVTEVELLTRDAREAHAAGDPVEARRRWSKVLHFEDAHPEARRSIARLDGLDVTDSAALPQTPGRNARRTALKEAKRRDRKAERRTGALPAQPGGS